MMVYTIRPLLDCWFVMEVIVRKGLLPAAVSVALAALCIQGCAKSGTNATSGEIEKTFVIGALWSETGEYAAMGKSMYQGAEFAVEEINNNGGVKVGSDCYMLKFIGADDESNPDMAKNAYNSLKDKEVQAVIGPIWDEGCISVEKSVNEDNILMIMPHSVSSGSGKYDCSFRLSTSNVKEGREIADYAFYQMNAKTAAVLYSAEDAEIADAFIKEFSDKGGNILSRETYTEDLQSLNSSISIIKEAEPDIIFIPANAETAEKILDRIERRGVGSSVIGDMCWYGIDGEFGDIEKMVFLSPFGKKSQKFAEDYKRKYGEPMDIYAAGGYDSAYTIKEALEEAGNTDSDLQICAMGTIKFDGATGNGISFDEYGNSTRDMEFVTVINNGKKEADE